MKKETSLWKVLRLSMICCLLSLSGTGLFAQSTIDVRGQILDVNGQEPLIGVSVFEKGTSNGTITDINGHFSLKATSQAVIVFSYIGYNTIEVKADQVQGVILMQEDSKTLDEVVIVGYGAQKKVNLSGAVSAIDGERIAAKPASDVLSALQGELPGVAVLRTSGQPGSETSGIRIRGYSSVNDTKALVLIDGIEGDLTLLNPNDIESISVLKDAAASSIYGARAAAGVVLVTTKIGKSGKTKISYDGYFGINVPGARPKRLPAWEEQVFINESRFNQGGSPEWTDEQTSWVANPNFNYRLNPTNDRWDFFSANNWVDEGTKNNTTQQSHSVSVSGGSDNLSYLVSANYYTKNGLLKYGPDSNDRYNFRAKIRSQINQYLTLDINASYDGKFMETPSYGATAILNTLHRARGRQPIYNPEEDINDSPYNGDLQVNPIDIMKNGGTDDRKTEFYTGKAALTIKDLVKGLRVNLSASRKAGYYSREVEKRTLIWYDRLSKTRRNTANNPNSLRKQKNRTYHDILEATVNYDLSLANHNFNLLAGTSYENYRKDEIDATVKNLNSNDFFSFNYYDTSLATNTSISDLIEPWAMMSYFGRVNYNYAERYLLEANIRYDGSSRLAPDTRWKAFPSFSFAWRVSEEKWFNVPLITNLKARASWGQLGNGAVLGFYDYLALIDSGDWMGEGYYYQKELASKNKTWETIESTNIGIDLGMLDNRLNFTADYYWKYNNDMLAPVYLPSQIGISTPNSNIGKLKTWGWEFEVSWKDKINELSYQVSFNLSDAKNKLVEYSGVNLVSEGTVKYLEGYPINSIWGYKTDGYWNSREEYLKYKEQNPGYQSFQDAIVSGGDVKYLTKGDKNHVIGTGDGTLDDHGDLVNFGDATGRYLYGINIGLQWRNFDFSMMFQGVGKRSVMVKATTIAPLYYSYEMPWTIHRDYAKVDENGTLLNPNAAWPRLFHYNGGYSGFNYKPSDRWIQDASYIRLKNITLGYTVPIKKNIVEKLRVYITGNDVWEHSDMLSVFDPEVGNEPTGSYYPFFRTWTFGVNVTF